MTTYLHGIEPFQGIEIQQLFQALLETKDDIKALKDELLTGVVYSYVSWDSNPPLFKLGFTTNLERRCKAHETRGYQHVAHSIGTNAFEKRLKSLLSKRGFKPVAGDETFLLTKEFLVLLDQSGWPIGDLANQINTFGFQSTLNLS